MQSRKLRSSPTLTLLKAVSGLASGRVAVLGDVMLDRYVIGEAERLSPEAPIPIVKVLRESVMLGGAGNVARNIVHLGGSAELVGVVGEDEAAEQIFKAAALEQRLTVGIVRDELRQTTVKTRFLAQGQQLLRVDQECTTPLAEAATTRLLGMLNAALKHVSVLVCSDYAKGVLTPATLAHAISSAKARGIPVIIDPKLRELHRYSGADIITPNAREAALATGIACDSDDGVANAARRIAELTGCRYVIVTRGPEGLTLLEAGNNPTVTHLPTDAREVHDVSGAGDTVVATLALALASAIPVADAARLANLAAGLVVAKRGTAVVEPAELISALDSMRHADARSKIVSLEAASAFSKAWRAQGNAIIFTNGCFDLLHPGHVSLLNHAKALGGKLIVAVNSDTSVRRLKGAGRPVQEEMARVTVLASLEAVDLVLIFGEDTPIKQIAEISPDVIVKGNDYREEDVVGADIVRSRGGRVVLAPIVTGHSTSEIIRKALSESGRPAS